MPNFDETVQLDSYALQDGSEVTLSAYGDKFLVEAWKADGENHWSLEFSTQDAARTEFNRWRGGITPYRAK